MSPRGTKAPALAVVGLVLAAHLTLAPNVADADSFYHVGHAAHYLEHGPFDTAFPWATQSVVRDLGADLWWGFHVVLLPFAGFDDPAIGIRLAAVFFTLVLAAVVWWVLARHGVGHAGWWTLAFLIAVPNVLYRYLMVRPHVLSLGAALLLLSLLVRGKRWQILAAAMAITWLHLGLFWMAPGILCAWALAQLGTKPGILFRASAAVLAGTLLGWLLRPHPLAAAELVYVQIVRLAAEKATDQPLTFAVELQRLAIGDLLRSSWLFLIAWIGAVAVSIRSIRQPTDAQRTLLIGCVLVSGAFLALTLLSARRALVELVAFGMLAVPLAWGAVPSGAARRRVALTALPLLLVHVPWAAHRHRLNMQLVAFPPDALTEAATWLAQSSSPGDVVFHAHWDTFGPLFARNRVNRYIGGMDPIFQYAHDPGRYWEHFYLSGDLIQEYTCDAFPCYEGVATDTHTAIRDHFAARWILVEPRRNPKLTLHLQRHAGFELVLETEHEAVFRVLDSAGPTSGDPGASAGVGRDGPSGPSSATDP